MAARVDWRRWIGPLWVAGLAAPVGVLAGVSPKFAIGAAVGIAFLLLISSDLATGVVLFTGISFFETVPRFRQCEPDEVRGPAARAGLVGHRGGPTRSTTRLPPRVPENQRDADHVPGLERVELRLVRAPCSAFDALSRLALNAILILIVFTAVRNERDVWRIFWAFIIGASFATIIGVLKGAGPTPYGEAARIASSSDDANGLAALLVASLALALGLSVVARRKPALRTVAFGAAALSLAGIVLTVSRSGLISLAVASVAAVVFAGRWRPRVLVISGMVIFSAVFYFAFLAPQTARDRVTDQRRGRSRARGHLEGRLANGRGPSRPRRRSRELHHLVDPLSADPARAVAPLRLHRGHPEGRPQRLPTGMGGDRRNRVGPVSRGDPRAVGQQ